VSASADDWRFSARFRRYDYNNESLQTAIPQYISYDTSVATARPEARLCWRTAQYVRRRRHVDQAPPLALTVGYTNNHNGYDFRIFQSTNENVLQLKADTVGSQWVILRAHYEYGNRAGSGLDQQSLVAIGEQPDLRHYDLANRTRHRVVGQVDVVPSEALTLSVSAGPQRRLGQSYFGLQEATFRNVSVSADYELQHGSRRRAACTTTSGTRACSNRDRRVLATRKWIPTGTGPPMPRKRVHYFSLYLRPPRFGATEARLSYDYSYALAISSMPSDPRCLRRRRCRRPSTSCRTSASTSGIA